MVHPVGPAMRLGSGCPKAGNDIVGRQGGKVAKMAKPKPMQHIDKIIEFGPKRPRLDVGNQRGYGKRTEKGSTCPGRNNPDAIRLGEHRRSHRGEPTISGTDMHGCPPCECRCHRRSHPLTHGLVTTEIAARPSGHERAHPGSVDLDAGCEFFERAKHGFENSGLACRVRSKDLDSWCTPLGFASPKPSRHPRLLGGTRRGHDTVAHHHDREIIEFATTPDHRPGPTGHDRETFGRRRSGHTKRLQTAEAATWRLMPLPDLVAGPVLRPPQAGQYQSRHDGGPRQSGSFLAPRPPE